MTYAEAILGKSTSTTTHRIKSVVIATTVAFVVAYTLLWQEAQGGQLEDLSLGLVATGVSAITVVILMIILTSAPLTDIPGPLTNGGPAATYRKGKAFKSGATTLNEVSTVMMNDARGTEGSIEAYRRWLVVRSATEPRHFGRGELGQLIRMAWESSSAATGMNTKSWQELAVQAYKKIYQVFTFYGEQELLGQSAVIDERTTNETAGMYFYFAKTSSRFKSLDEINAYAQVLDKSIVKLADQFSKRPFGRYRSESNSSGEAFREDVLLPELRKHELVIVDLEGTLGYDTPFLNEAFGKLDNKPDEEGNRLQDRVVVLARRHPSLMLEVSDYLRSSLDRAA